MKDFLCDTKPSQSWDVKSQRQISKTLPISAIKEFGKQILSSLIYLKNSLGFHMDNLHSGNIILANKRKLCFLTGFENEFFVNKNRSKGSSMNEEFLQKISKMYLIKIVTDDPNSDSLVVKKPKNDMEIKKLIEILRFGKIILDMCLGSSLELEDFIANPNISNQIQNSFNNKDAKSIFDIINYIFFNSDLIDKENPKLAKNS